MKRSLNALSFLMSLGAVLALTAGATVSLLSATTPSHNRTVPAGTVTLTNNVTGGCSVTNVLPGAAASTCTMLATYGGSAKGYLGLDILIETQAGNGGNKLYVPTDSSNDLQISVSSTSPSVSFTVPTVSTTCPGGALSGSTCYELDKELVGTTPYTSSSPTVTFTVSMSLPAGSTTGYRGGAAQVYLTAHAAQSSNNSLGSCTSGGSCSTMTWS